MNEISLATRGRIGTDWTCYSRIYVRYGPREPSERGRVGLKGSELARKLKRLARERGLEFSYDARHGKGSHGQLLFGARLTTVKDPKKEIGPGLLSDMLKQLGLTKEDLS